MPAAAAAAAEGAEGEKLLWIQSIGNRSDWQRKRYFTTSVSVILLCFFNFLDDVFAEDTTHRCQCFSDMLVLPIMRTIACLTNS